MTTPGEERVWPGVEAALKARQRLVDELRGRLVTAILQMEGDIEVIIELHLDIVPERSELFEELFFDDRIGFGRRASMLKRVLEDAGISRPDLHRRLAEVAKWRNKVVHMHIGTGVVLAGDPGPPERYVLRRPGRWNREEVNAEEMAAAVELASRCVEEVHQLAEDMDEAWQARNLAWLKGPAT